MTSETSDGTLSPPRSPEFRHDGLLQHAASQQHHIPRLHTYQRGPQPTQGAEKGHQAPRQGKPRAQQPPPDHGHCQGHAVPGARDRGGCGSVWSFTHGRTPQLTR